MAEKVFARGRAKCDPASGLRKPAAARRRAAIMLKSGDAPTLEINGRIHIPADEAARRAGLSRDYISQLARRGVLRVNCSQVHGILTWGACGSSIAQRAKNGSTKP